MENLIKSLKYVPKMWTALSYLVIILFAMTLFLGRNFQFWRWDFFLNWDPDFYSHISNFSISILIFITMGYVGLMFGINTRQILIVGILIILANLFVEFLIPFLNTQDGMDAVFGVIGVVMGLGYLILARRYGMRINDIEWTVQED